MWITGQCQNLVHHKNNSQTNTNLYDKYVATNSYKDLLKKLKSGSGCESAEWTETREESSFHLDSPCFLTLLFLFLSPPKNFPIWSRRPGFFFLRPSPKAACAELLADAIGVVVVGSTFVFVKCRVLVSLLNERVWKKNRGGKKRKEREGGKKS